jgi:hypothetical protein
LSSSLPFELLEALVYQNENHEDSLALARLARALRLFRLLRLLRMLRFNELLRFLEDRLKVRAAFYTRSNTRGCHS